MRNKIKILFALFLSAIMINNIGFDDNIFSSSRELISMKSWYGKSDRCVVSTPELFDLKFNTAIYNDGRISINCIMNREWFFEKNFNFKIGTIEFDDNYFDIDYHCLSSYRLYDFNTRSYVSYYSILRQTKYESDLGVGFGFSIASTDNINPNHKYNIRNGEKYNEVLFTIFIDKLSEAKGSSIIKIFGREMKVNFEIPEYDVNADGMIDILDMIDLNSYLCLGSGSGFDVNKDGLVNIMDLCILKKYLLEM